MAQNLTYPRKKIFSALGLNHDLVNQNPVLFSLSQSIRKTGQYTCSCIDGKGYKKYREGVIKDLRWLPNLNESENSMED